MLFFHLVCLGWLFFRADSLGQVGAMLEAIAGNSSAGGGIGLGSMALHLASALWLLLIFEFTVWRSNDQLSPLRWPTALLAVVHGVMICLIVLHASPGHAFIYFQF